MSADSKPGNRPSCQALATRVSVRHFGYESLSDGLISEILNEAAWSPSAGNLQPWRVTVLSTECSRDFIAQYEETSFEPVLPMLRSVTGLSCAETVAMFDNHLRIQGSARVVLIHHRPPGLSDKVKFFINACEMLVHRVKSSSKASEQARLLASALLRLPHNIRVRSEVILASLASFCYAMTLAAESRGVGSCFQMSYRSASNHLRASVGLTGSDELFAAVILGWPATNGEAPKRSRHPVTPRWLKELCR